MANQPIGQAELYWSGQGVKDNDFIGFTLGGIHSSSLGILRVSNGSRYEDTLLPAFSDKTVQVPGGDGTYYFGSFYNSRPLTISIAFDSMTEAQYVKMRQWIGDKTPRNLIFDETPYKFYKVKGTGTSSLKYVCFEDKGERVYKGEGTLQFICYSPYASLLRESGSKTEEHYPVETYPTRAQWLQGSGILPQSTMALFDKFNTQSVAQLYNPGQVECDLSIKVSFTNNQIAGRTFWINSDENRELTIQTFSKKGDDTAIVIDSKTNLIFGINAAGQKTGTTYNEFISSGHFFKVPVCGKDDGVFLGIKDGGPASDITLEYYWLYY